MTRIYSKGSYPAGGVGVPSYVTLQIDAVGTETALSFTYEFDPTQLDYVRTMTAYGLPSSAVLSLNESMVSQGKLGVLIDSATAFPPGVSGLITIQFAVGAGIKSYSDPLPEGFSSSPTAQSVSDISGSLLPTMYGNYDPVHPGVFKEDGTMTIYYDTDPTVPHRGIDDLRNPINGGVVGPKSDDGGGISAMVDPPVPVVAVIDPATGNVVVGHANVPTTDDGKIFGIEPVYLLAAAGVALFLFSSK